MEHLKRNLLALARLDLPLARRIGELDPARVPVVEASRAGPPTVAVAGPGGRPVYLHSRYEPLEEARRVVARHKVGRLDSVILLGFGLGHHLRELAGCLSPISRVYVVERDPYLFRAALESSDFSDLLDGRVRFLVATDEVELYAALRCDVARLFAGRVVLLAPAPFATADPAWYRARLAGLREFVSSGRVILQTAFVLPRVNLESRTAGIVEWLRGRSAADYRGRFEGRPAIVVAAGPSLRRNVETLRRAKGRALIVAVSTALKPLLARGIVPDFACVLDYHLLSRRYFEDIPAGLAPPLFCDPKANAEAIAAYVGPKLFPDDDVYDFLTGSACGPRGRMEGGATVAHTAFFLVRYLGCDPIAFVGLDLSYSAGVVHIPGTAIHGQRRGLLHRFQTLDGLEWEYFARERGRLSEVPGVDGGRVHTDELMLSYLRDFELLFRDTAARVYDCTEGGARKGGCEAIPLAEFCARHCAASLPAGVFAPPPEPELPARLEKARARLEELLGLAAELAGHYQAARGLLRRALNRARKDKDADRIVRRIHEVRDRMDAERFQPIAAQLAQLAYADTFQRSSRDLRIDGEPNQGVERQRLQLERDLEFVKGIARALEFLQRRMELALERVQAEQVSVEPVRASA